MKKLLSVGLTTVTLLAAILMGRTPRLDAAADLARASAVKLFQSLSDEQKKLAVLSFDDKERYKEVFPAPKRPGVPYSKLTAQQKELIADVVRAMTSAYGAERCLELARQTPEGSRYLTFFGEPSAQKPFAWRIGMHHLTLLFAEFGGARAGEFGPILLGGNPARKLWDAEEQLALELYAALSPEETKKILAANKGTSPGSGTALGKAGVRIADLNDKARQLATRLFQKRLDVFSADRRKLVDDIVARDGGVDKLRIAIWGAITKSHLEGGSYHWRIGTDSIVCDWQTVGKNHIHMTLRGRTKG